MRSKPVISTSDIVPGTLVTWIPGRCPKKGRVFEFILGIDEEKRVVTMTYIANEPTRMLYTHHINELADIWSEFAAGKYSVTGFDIVCRGK